MPSDDFERVRGDHLESLRRDHSHIVDALSGERLDALQQCVAIDMVGEAGVSSATDAKSLAKKLGQLHQMRWGGSPVADPLALLLTAEPAAGKTTLLSQLVVLSLDGELVPILVKVQLLQLQLIESPSIFEASWNGVDAFLLLKLRDGPHYRMLRQALASRRALLLLDGLDEGGANRAQIERHVVEVLAPQGHVLLVTSRPGGVPEVLFKSFTRLRLSPLTEAQQRRAIEQRLGGTVRAAPLLAYMNERMPLTTETGERVTSNPLMLSMVASVYQMRGDLGMPSTIAELYELASDAMLTRGRSDVYDEPEEYDELRRLLQAVFFEVHVRQRQLIEDWQLDEAALALDLPDTLLKIRRDALAAWRFDAFDGVIQQGHYVEVITGRHMRRRGVINALRGIQCHVRFEDRLDPHSLAWLKTDEARSSGLTEAVARAKSSSTSSSVAALRSACKQLPREKTHAALSEVRRRVKCDQLPLLSVLQVEPLQMQSSHLSFQEYFAARAICKRSSHLSGPPPWRWPAWWANAVKLGSEMGGDFGVGLLRAAGVKRGAYGGSLDVSSKTDGDFLTVLAVLVAISPFLTKVRAALSNLPDVCVLVLSGAYPS